MKSHRLCATQQGGLAADKPCELDRLAPRRSSGLPIPRACVEGSSRPARRRRPSAKPSSREGGCVERDHLAVSSCFRTRSSAERRLRRGQDPGQERVYDPVERSGSAPVVTTPAGQRLGPADLLRRDTAIIAHEGSSARPGLDQASLLKRGQRLADRASASPRSLGEVEFAGQALPFPISPQRIRLVRLSAICLYFAAICPDVYGPVVTLDWFSR